MASTEVLLGSEIAMSKADSNRDTVPSQRNTPPKITADTASPLPAPTTPHEDVPADHGMPTTPQSRSTKHEESKPASSGSTSSDDDDDTDIGMTTPAGTLRGLESSRDPDPESIAKSKSITMSANLSPPSIRDENSKPVNLTVRDPAQMTPEVSNSRDTPNLDFGDSLSAPEQEWINRVLKCCREKDGFDLYQLMAFESSTKHGIKDNMHYYYGILKALLCALTQSLGMIIIMVDYVHEGLECRDVHSEMAAHEVWDAVCPLDVFEFSSSRFGVIFVALQYKIVAFLFSAFLAFYCFDRLVGVEVGMYRKMKHAANLEFVNSYWLKIGLYVNVFASIFAVYGAFIVVFFSDNALDIVLNSVALFFVVELDDLLVKTGDYERIESYLNVYHRSTRSPTKSVQTPTFLKSEKLVTCKICYKKCGMGCRQCFHGLACCCGWLYGLPYRILQWVTIVLCFMLPFFIFTCYETVSC